MRRTDREQSPAFALKVLRDCEYATLATVNADGTPYCIPISLIVTGNIIYFHCAMEGQKLDNISRNNTVCVSGVRYTKSVPEKYTNAYESAVAVGKCVIVSDETEKIAALRAICEKYAGSSMENFDAAIAKSLHKTCVCRIDIEKITGKANKLS